MKKIALTVPLMILVGCSESPTAPTAIVESPAPVATPAPSPTPISVAVAGFDVSVQLDPAPIYGSTNPKYRWEVHPRLRIENTGGVLGHIVEVKMDVPGKHRDFDIWYGELETLITYDAISVGQTRQISWKLYFNWDKGFPQEVVFTVRIRDAYGEMHKYIYHWLVGGI